MTSHGSHSTALNLSGEDAVAFKSADAASYDNVTQAFAKFTLRFNEPLAEKLLDLCEPLQGKQLLDLGTGTGVVAFAAAARVSPGGTVTGLDLSEGMLQSSRERARAAGLDGAIRFVAGDAEDLDLPDESFDVVSGLFSLLHFPNRIAAIREVVRVLRPGGVACFGVGSAPPLTSLPGWLARLRRLPELWHVRRGHWLNATDALDVAVAEIIPESGRSEIASEARRAFGFGAETLALLKDAGLVRTRGEWLGRRERIDSVEEFWELQATYSTYARKRLAAASEQQRQRVRQLHDERAREVLARGGVLSYAHAAFYAVGNKRGAFE